MEWEGEEDVEPCGRWRMHVPLPRMVTGVPPTPFTERPGVARKSERRVASLTMMRLAPLSMINRRLSESQTKQCGDGLGGTGGVGDVVAPGIGRSGAGEVASLVEGRNREEAWEMEVASRVC
jgi:hypothetical protein